ncbi:Uncharacterized membrane protein YhaH, DUF805 family [Cyclonatronum proteinivorum]|uniref:Uncharacterized membrane protein YhaH, DUF805 family n=1 Tax=Cyclonatronum proteinivorum TaxID=1457365 RepID=A0A345UIQ4_9BACT|nr:DUF805 domain-containing protein [Cyclonatronum proteinivorum]AXJ00356.1 Uncharacterized membrane protein YhaH, DUF805 family [Cyclonatronum proteinivorum]
MAKGLKECPKCGEVMHKAYPRCVTCNHNFLSKSYSGSLNIIEKGNNLHIVEDDFFSTDGRIRRSTYFIRSLLLAIPNLFFAFPSDTGLYQYPGIIIFFLLIIIGLGIVSMIQGVKRLHDMNLEGVFVFLLLVPIVNLFFYIFMLIKDSYPGKNEFGEDPKKSERITNREFIKPSFSKNKPNRENEQSLTHDYKITDLEYLEKLANLKERGVISEEEFKSKKQKILGL